MAAVLGDAFQSIAQALAQMQGAMWAMNDEMTRTDCAIGGIVRSLQEQGASVEKLDRRMQLLEQRAHCTYTPAAPPAAPPAAYGYPCAYPSAAPPAAAAPAHAPPAYPTAAYASTPVLTPLPAAPPPSSASVTTPRALSCTPSAAAPCPSARPSRRQAELGARLVVAVECGRARHVQRLLDGGADVNFVAEGSTRTPLLRATAKGFADVVSLLLKRGANLGTRDREGRTALHIAADNDYSSRCVGLLLQAGADASSRDARGRTPLHWAAECGNEASAIALLAAGASRHAEDDRGKRPADVAKMMCLRKRLQPPGADPGRARRSLLTRGGNRAALHQHKARLGRC